MTTNECDYEERRLAELVEACRPAVEWGDKFNAPGDPIVVIELTRDEFDAMKAACDVTHP